ncbi:CORVET complex subunit [Maudiozyma humilis]|uniref:CORVET complex subunit n=1 Tax=Maudiozyma humilis TaxID=51915 RepID=A0AAV5S0E3_MAUHU|nr:CORVET complex subunit [Kazachstania humilis]
MSSDHESEHKEEPGTPVEVLTTHISDSKGPWFTFPIISDLPEDNEISVIESYDEHVYIGTTSGEILHYFEIECGNYLLVSRTNFDESNKDQQGSIDKIIILPTIEKACILSASRVVLFLLPEMAPAPNVERIAHVNDVVLRNIPKGNDKRFKNSYELLLFSDEHVRNLVVSENGFRQNKQYDFKLIETGVCHDSIVMTAKLNNYEIVNLGRSQVIPLFRISELVDDDEDTPTLPPMIRSFDDKSFLVCSGGSSYEHNAMVLVVDHNGDLTGTAIELEHYPTDIVVKYPYLFVQYKDDSIELYRFSDEQKAILQSITETGSKLRLFDTHKSFKYYENPDVQQERCVEVQELVVDKLTLVPINEESVNDSYGTEDKEKQVREIYEETTSVVLANKSVMYAVASEPIFLSIDNFDKSEMELIENYLKSCPELNLKTKFSILQRNYLQVLYLLLDILHCEEITDVTVEMWCDKIKSIDIRLLFDLLGFKTYGDLWIYRSLKKTYVKIKGLKLRNKTSGSPRDLMRSFTIASKKILSLLEGEKASIQDSGNIVKTIDVNLFMLEFDEGAGTVEDFDINKYNVMSQYEIIAIIRDVMLPKDDSRKGLLIKAYQQKDMYSEALSILREDIDDKDKTSIYRLFDFIQDNVEKFPEIYRSKNIMEDVVFVIEKLDTLEDSVGMRKVIKRIIALLEKVHIDIDLLLQKVEELEESVSIKVFILEEVGVEDNAGDKSVNQEFLVKYYIEKLHAEIIKKELWATLEKHLAAYRQDMNYDKMKLKKYLLTKIRKDSAFQEFLSFHKKIIRISKNSESIFTKITDEVAKFDKDSILFILFAAHENGTNEENKKSYLQILMDNNAFLEIQQHVNAENYLSIFDYYIETVGDVDLDTEFLKRTQSFLDDTTLYREVLRKIPADCPLWKISPLILRRLQKQQTSLERSELEKSLFKDEVCIYSDILNKLGT